MKRAAGSVSAVVGLLAAAALAPSAQAASKTFTVTTTGDPAPGSCAKKSCSLREATIAANDHPGADEIVLKGGKTYKLVIPGTGEDNSGYGDLDLKGPTTMRAVGKKMATIDANNLDNGVSALSGDLRFVGIKVEHANGDGIFASGASVSMTDSASTNNSGAGVDQQGTGSVKVVDSTLSHDNYGIEESAAGDVTVKGGFANDDTYGVAEFDAGSIHASNLIAAGDSQYGVEETAGGSATVKKSTIKDCGGYAVTEFDAGNVSVSRSNIEKAQNYGVEETGPGSARVSRTHVNDAGSYAITEFDAGDLRVSRVQANGAGNYAVEETGSGSIIGSRVSANDSGAYGITEFDEGGLKLDRATVKRAMNFGAETTGTGDWSVKRSTIADSGGTGVADFSSGKGKISASTITGNKGGGVEQTDGQVALTDSTISGNTATGFGAGALVTNGAMSITNSTFDGNRSEASGGGIAVVGSGSATLNAVTATRNVADDDGGGGDFGGGIYQSTGTTAKVENSLIAANKVGVAMTTGVDCYNETGPFDSAGHNLIGTDNGCTGFGGKGDLIGKSPKVGKLAKNGGPTKTVALKAGSPAIGAAGKSAPASDQRGHKRDKHPDIGAFER